MAAFFEGGASPATTAPPAHEEEAAAAAAGGDEEEEAAEDPTEPGDAPFLVVKVQLPPRDLLRGPGEPAWDLLLSDELRSVEYRVPRELPGAERLASVAAARGVARSKVFLRAARTERGTLAVDMRTPVPALPW